MRVRAATMPASALLARYANGGHYTDCFSAIFPREVTLQQFVEAFYTTALFKSERLILKWAISKPSSDAEVVRLAHGELSDFAAWSVEDRADNQLLMTDFRGQTRSWFMVEPLQHDGAAHARLYFGSAVIAGRRDQDDTPRVGRSYSLLLGFHRLYSLALLWSAAKRLRRVG